MHRKGKQNFSEGACGLKHLSLPWGTTALMFEACPCTYLGGATSIHSYLQCSLYKNKMGCSVFALVTGHSMPPQSGIVSPSPWWKNCWTNFMEKYDAHDMEEQEQWISPDEQSSLWSEDQRSWIPRDAHNRGKLLKSRLRPNEEHNEVVCWVARYENKQMDKW